jgi:hypothetical protein
VLRPMYTCWSPKNSVLIFCILLLPRIKAREKSCYWITNKKARIKITGRPLPPGIPEAPPAPEVKKMRLKDKQLPQLKGN